MAANTGVGLLVPGGSVNNTIGGTTAADRNVISGNGAGGIQISGQAIVEGNFIGTDTTGQAPVGNQGNGITITLTQFSSIGGIVPGARQYHRLQQRIRRRRRHGLGKRD